MINVARTSILMTKKESQDRPDSFPKGLMYSNFLDTTDLFIQQIFLRCLRHQAMVPWTVFLELDCAGRNWGVLKSGTDAVGLDGPEILHSCQVLHIIVGKSPDQCCPEEGMAWATHSRHTHGF